MQGRVALLGQPAGRALVGVVVALVADVEVHEDTSARTAEKEIACRAGQRGDIGERGKGICKKGQPMIDEGEGAPVFELPAVVAGEIETVALADHRGTDVVILAFYPGDFNPACDGEETDLDELDLFTMQKDVTVLAVSGDGVFSHRAFADEYDLHIPLLADVEGAVAEAYGVAADPADGYHTKRAVVVVGPSGDVAYVWSTDGLRELPPVERVREAVDDVGGSETALARYRVGHAHYVEGRRVFTSAMGNFADEEWMMARSDFTRAYEEFEDAAAQFNTADRFADDETAAAHYERAEDKAELLWQAAEWLAESADAFSSGEGAEGQAMRGDAEAPLEEARRYPEPLAPGDFPPDGPPAPLAAVEGERDTFLPDDETEIDASLDVDIDADAYADDDLRASVEGQASAESAGTAGAAPGGEIDAGATASAALETDDKATEASGAAQDGAAGEGTDDRGDGEGGEDADAIDEAELEEITAELEEQTEAAQAAHERVDEDEAEARTEESASADEDESVDGDDLELDLTDPTEGEGLAPLEDEDEEGEADLEEESGGGDHGVPDSL